MAATDLQSAFTLPHRNSTSDTTKAPSMDTPPASIFLRLPPELRTQIYEYILPTTTRIASKHDNGLVWLRGHTALLATNRQIYEECVALIYGRNTFVIEVNYDCILFRYRWLLPSNRNLAPNRAFSFLDHFSQRNIQRIQNYYIRIEHVDSYTGMIKYNCGGRGLTDGLREQVRRLMAVLRYSGDLNKVEVWFVDKKKRPQDTQVVLEPLLLLREVRRALIAGDVMPEFADYIQHKMSLSMEERSAERVQNPCIPDAEPSSFRPNATSTKLLAR